MPDHRGSRFALEVLFLLALAVGLTLADLQPLEIGGVMLLGWLIRAGGGGGGVVGGVDGGGAGGARRGEGAALRERPAAPLLRADRQPAAGPPARAGPGRLPRGAARRGSDVDRLRRAPRRDARGVAAHRAGRGRGGGCRARRAARFAS